MILDIHAIGRILRSLFARRRYGQSAAELYFHSPCFDGVVSAVLTLDFLETHEGWSSIRLTAVNYNLKPTWRSRRLGDRSAVVDFLYHPDATFWADHHSTSFGANGVTAPKRDPDHFRVFDAKAPSCAGLIQEALAQHYQYRNSLYESLVCWATKIDAARYDSVEEAIFGDAPALRINLAFQVSDQDYPATVVRELQRLPLETVASMPATDSAFLRAQSLVRAGLQRFELSARMTDEGIVTFDFFKADTILNRYSPYYFFPDATYSVGIVQSEGRVTVTAMRNPWREFDSIDLGKLLEPLGGGGHQRVGSVAFRGPQAQAKARNAASSVVNALTRSSSNRSGMIVASAPAS